MVEFFRDVLDGPLYIAVVVLSIIFIMAIIGFLMERKKLEKEAKEKVAVISNGSVVTPIQPVSIEVETEMQPPVITIPETPSVSDTEKSDDPSEEKPPIIVFEDPDQKKE